jgi:hypothetical protein
VGVIIVFFVVWLTVIGLMAFAVLDAALTPKSVWEAADLDRLVWVLVTLLLPFIGAIAYLVAVRPKLRRERRRAETQFRP